MEQVQESVPKSARDMSMLAHLLGFGGFFIPFGNIIGPLIVWLLKRSEHAFIDHHGKEAMNFQVSFTIYGLLLSMGFFFSILSGNAQLLTPVLIIVLISVMAVAYLVFMIIAAIKANEGKLYRYPLTISFLN